MPVFSGTAAADRIVGSAEADQIYSLDGNDTLYGAGGNDWLIGGLGNDILVGGLGDDSYDVDSAGDQVVERAGEGIDRVRASISHQLAANVEILTLSGTADINGFGNVLDNTILGNAGNNVLNGGAGNDAMAGGAGNDVYDVDSTGDVVSEGANAGYDRVRASIDYTLGANVEELNLTGTSAIDGTGNALNNALTGNSGANTLEGGLGDDVLLGGEGDDDLLGGAGKDKLLGGGGNDLLEIRGGDLAAGEIYDGGVGNDTLVIWYGGGVGVDLRAASITGIEAFSAHDRVTLSASQLSNFSVIDADYEIRVGNGGVINLANASYLSAEIHLNDVGNTLYLPDQSDDGFVSIYGGASADVVIGGGHREFLHGGAGNDRLEGGGGNDQLTGDAGRDALLGGEGDDTLGGADGDDVLEGGAGADRLVGGAGSDRLVGGLGNDVYDFSFDRRSAGDVIIEAAGEGTDQVIASFDYTLDANVENLTLADTIFGLRGIGNALNNVIRGGSYLDGGAGDDTLIGGNYTDTYIVDSTGDVVIHRETGFGSGTIMASASYTLPAYLKTLILTGTGDLNGTGNDLGNWIYGNSGRNILDGGAGDDVIFIAKDGDLSAGETYIGGAGYDELSIGFDVHGTQDLSHATLSGIESLIAQPSVIILTAAQLGQFADITAFDLTLITGGVVNLSGARSINISRIDFSDQATTLILPGGPASSGALVNGGAGDDVVLSPAGGALYGHGGNDTLTAGARQDFLDGGTGNDHMTGGAGNDHYEVDAAGDRVIELAAGGIDEVFSSISFTLGANVENLVLTGTQVINAVGNDLNNRLTGNEAANTINAGAGDDIVDGRAGADTLRGGAGADIFNLQDGGGDTILDFTRAEGDKLAFWSNVTYIGDAAFTGNGNAEARFAEGHLLVDVYGVGEPGIVINLVGITAASQLQASDFIFSPI